MRRMQCVRSVGAGLLDRPAVGRYHCDRAWAQSLPGAREGREAFPYERRWAVAIC